MGVTLMAWAAGVVSFLFLANEWEGLWECRICESAQLVGISLLHVDSECVEILCLAMRIEFARIFSSDGDKFYEFILILKWITVMRGKQWDNKSFGKNNFPLSTYDDFRELFWWEEVQIFAQNISNLVLKQSVFLFSLWSSNFCEYWLPIQIFEKLFKAWNFSWSHRRVLLHSFSGVRVLRFLPISKFLSSSVFGAIKIKFTQKVFWDHRLCIKNDQIRIKNSENFKMFFEILTKLKIDYSTFFH